MVTRESRKQSVFVIHHQGMGDMLVCLGLYRALAERHDRVIIPAKEPNLETIRHALSDMSNLEVIKIPFMSKRGRWGHHVLRVMTVMSWVFRLVGFRTLRLGTLGDSFLSDAANVRFDENFYQQAGIPFSERWNSFSYPHRKSKEDELFSMVESNRGRYIFLHEDQNRGYTIDRTLLPEGLPVFTPIAPPNSYFVTDYAKVIEGATEIHVIESSFAALIEGLSPKGAMFAHRYARPEAKGNWKHEFTYRNKWKVYPEVLNQRH
jgi:hypothetical protein